MAHRTPRSMSFQGQSPKKHQPFFSFAQVTSSVDTTLIRIGEEIKYTIQVEADSTDLVLFPEGQSFSPLEMMCARYFPPCVSRPAACLGFKAKCWQKEMLARIECSHNHTADTKNDRGE